MTDNSLREYYVKLHNLYTNGINLLSALNQSLTSNAAKISVDIINDNNTTDRVSIPSFLYLDSKLEQLETTINNLFDMPKTGEAWFNNIGNMYKLELVKSNIAPLTPAIDMSVETYAYSSVNTFLKDLVTPHVHLRLNIPNLPHNITEMYMKKLVVYNNDVFFDLASTDSYLTYDNCQALLYGYTKGVDYDEYDSNLPLPIKQDKYASEFKILNIIKDGYLENNLATQLTYKVLLDTLEYSNIEDSSITYTIQIDDNICLADEMAIYKVTDIDYSTGIVTMTEEVGHIALQPYSENNQMILKRYNYDYSEFNYIDIPLEENPYICVFLGTVYNGVRSQLSYGLLFDLNQIKMVNDAGSYMLNDDGSVMTYMEFYDKFCVNIGDLILGLTETAYPQLSNFTSGQLQEMTEGDNFKLFVNNSITDEKILSVVPINNHIYEDGIIKTIKEYHAQKNSLQAELATITENINTNNNTLLTTDWSLETDITQNKIQSQLQGYYTERLTLEKQLNGVVNELNKLTRENNVNAATKYRVRGVTNVSDFETYINTEINNKVKLIGIDVEYKYKAVSKEVTDLKNINNSTFTDWNKLETIDRQRKLTFNKSTGEYVIDFVNYDNIANIIKWNQIDIPITNGEDVIIRVRYKYNIGQPFINLYSPWSDEITVSFPTEYAEQVELPTILAQNDVDVYEAKFTGKLINDGYEEHITNNIVVSNKKFFHTSDNIYSGFNTAENNLLSLKEKLDIMCKDIASYSDLVESENQKKMSVYLQYDGKTVELFSNTTNKINIYNTEHINTNFVKNEMNIVIKNTGEVPLNLYSIFPGQTDVPLVHCNYEYYIDRKTSYEHYPLIANGELMAQTLGQWIYFREKNPYTGKSILYQGNRSNDKERYNEPKNAPGLLETGACFKMNNMQLGLPFVLENTDNIELYKNKYYGFITKTNIQTENIKEVNYDNIIDEHIYYKQDGKNAVYRYGDFYYMQKDEDGKPDVKVSLDSKGANISSWLTAAGQTPEGQEKFQGIETTAFSGAFLYVNLDNSMSLITNGGEKDNYEIKVGESISIPIVFEYFFDSVQNSETYSETYTKTIMFDIRKSLLTNPLNFILEITANNIINLNDLNYLQ